MTITKERINQLKWGQVYRINGTVLIFEYYDKKTEELRLYSPALNTWLFMSRKNINTLTEV